MIDLDLIVRYIETFKYDRLSLENKRILITSGGTRESIDKVRYISNGSSGKLGETLTHMASFFGADVRVISTNPMTENPLIKDNIVSSVSEMKSALDTHISQADVLIMAAAVSDFTVKQSNSKLKRKDSLHLQCQRLLI